MEAAGYRRTTTEHSREEVTQWIDALRGPVQVVKLGPITLEMARSTRESLADYFEMVVGFYGWVSGES